MQALEGSACLAPVPVDLADSFSITTHLGYNGPQIHRNCLGIVRDNLKIMRLRHYLRLVSFAALPETWKRWQVQSEMCDSRSDQH